MSFGNKSRIVIYSLCILTRKQKIMMYFPQKKLWWKIPLILPINLLENHITCLIILMITCQWKYIHRSPHFQNHICRYLLWHTKWNFEVHRLGIEIIVQGHKPIPKYDNYLIQIGNETEGIYINQFSGSCIIF